MVLRTGRGTAIDGVKIPSASLAVVSQGKPYKLLAVIYDHDGCHHFSCQARICGRWIYYDDVSMGNGKPTLYGDFNPTPENDSAGKPYMFLYARDYDTERKRERELDPNLVSTSTHQDNPISFRRTRKAESDLTVLYVYPNVRSSI